MSPVNFLEDIAKGSGDSKISNKAGEPHKSLKMDKAAYAAKWEKIDKEIGNIHVEMNLVNREIFNVVNLFNDNMRVLNKALDQAPILESKLVADYLALQRSVKRFRENVKRGNETAWKKLKKIEQIVLGTEEEETPMDSTVKPKPL